MGNRRDDITIQERMQIASTVLSAQREWGTVTELAKQYALSRESIYAIADAGKRVLLRGLGPLPHGPQVRETTVHVDRNRLIRSVVALTEVGVSQRDIAFCLAEMLDTHVSSSWINGELTDVEGRAAQVNAAWQPTVAETLAGDEIYANGAPNLLVVGNDSLYIYALTRQRSCDGDTWGCVLLDSPAVEHFASDGGTGLAAGAKLADIAGHQLDWDHLLRPVWGHVTRLEKQAYAALEAVEARAAKFDQATTTKRLAHHLAAWERLTATATDKVTRYDAFYQLACQVDAQFALIDIQTGQLRDSVAAATQLRAVGQQLHGWTGRIYEKLSRNLTNWAEGLFHYQAELTQALALLREQWGILPIQALCRMWQLEADEQRQPLPWSERRARQLRWEESLDVAVTALGAEQLWEAWETLGAVLNRVWRGSMLAECVNSLLRPILDRRKHTDQGCLELFRFLHNVRPFQRGKRAGASPAQLVGLEVPEDPFVLLGLAPKVSS